MSFSLRAKSLNSDYGRGWVKHDLINYLIIVETMCNIRPFVITAVNDCIDKQFM